MLPSPWLFVHEYLAGGGCSAEALPEDLAGEGAAMLAAVLADYAAWGRVRTLTTLDRRLAHLRLPADEVLLVGPGQHWAVWQAALRRCDAALMIAPETGGILARLNAQALAAGRCLLGSEPAAVRLAGDKWACYRQWQAADVPAPLTAQATVRSARQAAAALGFPLVVKPLDGVGCAGVCLARDAGELAQAVALAGSAGPRQPILLQRYVAGKHASASLLVAGERSLALSLNRQDIAVGCPFSYRGGAMPLSEAPPDGVPAAAQAAALAVAQAAAAALPGLQGYVGVDLVLDGDRAWAIEINPRLTTAYIGLRRVVDINLAQAIWEAAVNGALPAAVRLQGQATFSKDRPGGLGEAL